MRVHYFQHVPFEGLGYIEHWLHENHHVISVTRFYEANYTLPQHDDIDALVIMGGPMSVNDETDYPWLIEEKAFITATIKAEKKVLGICLGAQLIATCLGAKVQPAPNKEIGWFPVFPSQTNQPVNGLSSLFQCQPTVLHWHGEQFGLPMSCLNLLDSAANHNQLLYCSDQVIGLQFHLETTLQTMTLMLDNCHDDLTPMPYIQSTEQIRAGIRYLAENNQIMSAILTRWLG